MGGEVLSVSTIWLSIKHEYCTKICMQQSLIDSLWLDIRLVIVDERHIPSFIPPLPALIFFFPRMWRSFQYLWQCRLEDF